MWLLLSYKTILLIIKKTVCKPRNSQREILLSTRNYLYFLFNVNLIFPIHLDNGQDPYRVVVWNMHSLVIEAEKKASDCLFVVDFIPANISVRAIFDMVI